MTQCWIGLGGNQGDVPGAIAEVVRRLRTTFAGPVTVSPLFRTVPMGAAAGSEFCNAVAGCQASLPPHELLQQLQQWETDLGRVRDVRWGPRTIDLDLLFDGDSIIDTAELTLPHPGAWYRRFVLEPLRALAPQLVHPVWGRTIEQLHARLTTGAPSLWLYCPEPDLARELTARLQTRLPPIAIHAWNGLEALPTGLLIAVHAPPHSAVPHLRLSAGRPIDELEQAIADACTAAFDVPQRVTASPSLPFAVTAGEGPGGSRAD